MKTLRSHFRIAIALCAAAGFAVGFRLLPLLSGGTPAATVEQPQAPFTDYRHEQPGAIRKITVADLPEPYQTKSSDNRPHLVARPADAWPKTLPGFTVTQFATGLQNPRLIRRAPNGDLFVAESEPGQIRVLRGIGADGKAQTVEVFATGLTQPFGIAFYPPGPDPQYIYVGNTGSVVRFPYRNGDLKARGAAETIVPDIPSGGRLTGGGHWTRDIAFTRDGKKMFVSVGSHSNDDDADTHPQEFHRADILEFNPDGTGLQIYAYGIRNPVGIAMHPTTGELWASVNERDALGDNLVPDYITHVQPGGFYGWPWYYMGGHQDPRQQGKHPELKNKVITPDVLLQPHNASLEMTFYDGSQFPAEYRGDIFAAEHGSWNKSVRVGYEVIRVPMKDGHAKGEYEDFLTGFVTADGGVWGRPVGVAVAQDGSLIVTDDGSNSLWRVSYSGR
ncbi:MAG TPA: sorbosone dehydrogenase family protein [Bryobacteraceae bacterium]|nr:sorbosone dehydrogenase family protein [Bryobacteraceae bacterium]